MIRPVRLKVNLSKDTASFIILWLDYMPNHHKES